MTRLGDAQVLAWRWRRQQLAERAPAGTLLDVVSRISGLHAQVASCAALSAWARVEDLEPDAVATALEARQLVKTWAMRGTLHLLPAEELPAYVAALSALRPRHHVPAWLRAHGLTRPQADAMLAAIEAVLDGEPRTREELADAVAARTGHAELAERLRGGFGDLLKPAAFAGALCFADPDERRVRFVAPARWLGPQAPAGPDDAIPALMRRYLAAYGPAPREQFQRWFGMTSPAEAGRWIARLGDDVAEVEVGRTRARGWMLAADVEEAAASEPPGVVRLLPGFDPYVVAAPRGDDAVVAGAHRARVYRPQGWISPTLTRDGRILGTWRHDLREGAAEVEIETFGRMPAATRAGAEAEAELLAAGLGAPLHLRWA